MTSPSDGLPGARRQAHKAMNTLFEVVVCEPDADYARQACDAAFAEVDRLERDLSRFREDSDVARIRRLPAGEGTRVGPDTFACLRVAEEIRQATGGAFDVACGVSGLVLDDTSLLVRTTADCIPLDLGGIGKGYAVDRIAGILREWDLGVARIQAGSSTVLALDPPSGAEGWALTLRDLGPPPLAFRVARRSMSGSGLPDGRPHILDPRTGHPAEGARAAWAAAPNATWSDALSTAFMVMSPESIRCFCADHPEVGALTEDPQGTRLVAGTLPPAGGEGSGFGG